MLNNSPFDVKIINEYPDGMVECIIKDKSGITPDTHAFFNINDCDVFMEPFKGCGFFISSIFLGLMFDM